MGFGALLLVCFYSLSFVSEVYSFLSDGIAEDAIGWQFLQQLEAEPC